MNWKETIEKFDTVHDKVEYLWELRLQSFDESGDAWYEILKLMPQLFEEYRELKFRMDGLEK